jgi:hypothetical protein
LWKKVNQPFKAMCERMNDKEIFEIERILDDLETYVQSHIKERRVILAEILKIRRILKSDEQQIFYKDS